jgi:hypothetical protein
MSLANVGLTREPLLQRIQATTLRSAGRYLMHCMMRFLATFWSGMWLEAIAAPIRDSATRAKSVS